MLGFGMKRVSVAAIALAMGVSLAGCSIHGSSSSSKQSSGTSSQAQTGSTQTTVAAAPSLTRSDLHSELLTPDELPGSGWALNPSLVSSSGTSGSSSFCSSITPPNGVKPVMEAQVGISQANQNPPFIAESIQYFNDATSAYSTGVKALQQCASNGGLTPIALAPDGDQSAAWSFTSSSGGVTLYIDVAVVRQGNQIMLVLYADLGPLATSDLQTLVDTAYGNLM